MKDFFELNLKVRKLSYDQSNFSEFELQPLVQGFGMTLGNSLRRVLLTSVLGAAIYAFKIDKVEQEFQNLVGCSENVVQIGLNIQKIIVSVDNKVFPDEKTKIVLKLNAKKKGKFLARDIELPAGVKIINPEQEVVNVVKVDRVLEMEFFVIQGHGFSNFQDNKLLTQGEIGVFTVSSNFSHVWKVVVKVEEIKVGQYDVSERLILGIQTNGAISPVFALVNGAKILSTHLNYFINLDKSSLTDFQFKTPEKKSNILPKLEIKNLDFSERTVNSLEAAGITNLDQLIKKRQSELLIIKNLGQKSLKEIVDRLKQDFKVKLKD